MSTSDPDRPGTGGTPDTSAPTPEPSTVPTDTGRHAVVRPAPTPPPDPVLHPTSTDAHAPADPPRPAATTPVEPSPAATPVATAAGPAAPTAPRAEPGDDDLFPAPNAPRSTSVGAHVLGALVGLLLAPAGMGLVLVGQARILDAQVEGWDGSTEVLGIVLVTIGLLLLGLVALLAVWSAAVPVAGGALLTVAGAFYLFAPSIARTQTLGVLDDMGWRLTITQVIVSGTSGTLLVAGFLVLLAGVAAAVARRRGVHLGEFRERHRV